METEARQTIVGNAAAWFAYRGNKVLCDKLIRARRFKTSEAAMKAGKNADGSEFY